jgi:hypothetical protein
MRCLATLCVVRRAAGSVGTARHCRAGAVCAGGPLTTCVDGFWGLLCDTARGRLLNNAGASTDVSHLDEVATLCC